MFECDLFHAEEVIRDRYQTSHYSTIPLWPNWVMNNGIFYVLRKLWNALSVNIYRWMKYLRFFLTPEPLFWNYFNNLTHSIRTWHKLVWWNDFQGDSSALISLLQIGIRWSLQRCIVCISIEWFNCWIIQCFSFLGAIFIPGQICHVSHIKFSME